GRAAPQAAVRYAPLRVARRRGRRVPSRAWRHAAAAPTERLRSGGALGDPGERVREGSQLLRLRLGRVGAQMAGRGDLEGPQARVSVPPAPPIVLASVSPQRRAILEQLGVPFDVVAPSFEESGDDPVESAAG